MTLLWPRPEGLDLLKETYINTENTKQLARAADKAWEAIKEKNLDAFADSFMDSFDAQTKMFPAMINSAIEKVIETYKEQAMAWKLAGAGGGGYLILVAENQPKGTMRIKVRRKETQI